MQNNGMVRVDFSGKAAQSSPVQTQTPVPERLGEVRKAATAANILGLRPPANAYERLKMLEGMDLIEVLEPLTDDELRLTIPQLDCEIIHEAISNPRICSVELEAKVIRVREEIAREYGQWKASKVGGFSMKTPIGARGHYPRKHQARHKIEAHAHVIAQMQEQQRARTHA